MTFDDYCQYDAIGLSKLIAQKQVSADDVLNAALSRLEAVNPTLNLLAHNLQDKAKTWQGDPKAPLYGVPFLLKDLLAEWQDTPMWCGSRLMQGYVSRQNSDLTTAYLQSGLRIFGKTTTPEWGLYPVTESQLYGDTKNPYHLDYTSGGSSGGSAVAVASGVVPIAHGGDGGGSIRLPAHNCGLFGLKPTRGRTSLTPYVSESWQGLVCEHVLTRTVQDSALLLDIATSTQKKALYACPPAPKAGFLASLNQPLNKLTIAYHKTPYFGGSNDHDTRQAFDKTLKLLETQGHTLIEDTPKFASSEVLNRAARVLIIGEMAALLYHFRQQTGKLPTHHDFDAPAWALVAQGQKISAGELAWARGVLLAQERIARTFFDDVDVLVTPVCPRTTPKLGEMLPSALQQRLIRLLFGTLNLGKFLADNPLIEQEAIRTLHYVGYTFVFNMSGNPAMSVPLQQDSKQLPLGMQFVAGHGKEDTLLRLAKSLHEICPWENKIAPF